MGSLSAQDRDAMVRTVLTEARQNDPLGQAAVASVIRNRLASGSYGDSPMAIVTAPSQFEPWQRGTAQAVNPNSPQYEAAGRIVDAVANGLPDPTNGATHFYAPDAQATLGRAAPKWGQGKPTAALGGHLFFAPQGAVTFANAGDGSTSTAPASPTNEAKPVASADDVFSRWKIGGDASAPIAAPDAKAAPENDPFSRWNIAPDKAPPASPSPATATGPMQASTGAGDTLLRKANAFLGGAINGVPIVGPAVKSGAEHAAAAVLALQHDLKYSDALKIAQGIAAQTQAENPLTSTAGNIAGTGASLVAAGGVPLIARGLGFTGPSLLQRSIVGAGGNALLGSADAAVRGEDATNGAAFGAGGGLIGPAVGKVVGAGLTAAGNGISNMLAPTGIAGLSRSGANMLTNLIRQEGPQNVQAELSRLGPNGMLADAGPSLQSITGALAGKPDAAQPVVLNALGSRAQGANARLGGDITAALGPAPVPSQVQAGIKGGMETLGPEYQQAYAGASAVNTQPLADALDAQAVNLRGPARDALVKVRGFLNIPGDKVLDPNPQALHATREAIDGLLANEQNPQVIRQLTIARQGVDSELAKAVPGIKDIDAKYAELARQTEALKSGGSVLDSGKTAINPVDFAQNFPASANPQGTLVGPSAAPLRTQQGIRAEVDRLVGTKSNDLGALKTALQGEGGWNTAKLSTAFGNDNTNQLLNAVERERTFANTNNLAAGNSKTSLMNQGNKLLDAADPEAGFSLLPTTAVGASLAAGKWAAHKAVQTLMASSSEPMRVELAKALTDTGPGAADRLKAIIALAQKQSTVSSGAMRLGGYGDRAANALTIGAVNSQRNSFLSK